MYIIDIPNNIDTFTLSQGTLEPDINGYLIYQFNSGLVSLMLNNFIYKKELNCIEQI